MCRMSCSIFYITIENFLNLNRRPGSRYRVWYIQFRDMLIWYRRYRRLWKWICETGLRVIRTLSWAHFDQILYLFSKVWLLWWNSRYVQRWEPLTIFSVVLDCLSIFDFGLLIVWHVRIYVPLTQIVKQHIDCAYRIILVLIVKIKNCGNLPWSFLLVTFYDSDFQDLWWCHVEFMVQHLFDDCSYHWCSCSCRWISVNCLYVVCKCILRDDNIEMKLRIFVGMSITKQLLRM